MGPRLGAHRRQLVLVGLCLLASLGLTLAAPLLLRSFIDLALEGGSGSMTSVAAGFLVVALLAQLVSVAQSWLSTDLSSRTTNRLRSELSDHVLGLDIAFHRRTPPGELIERVDGDVGQVGVLLGNFLPQMIQEALLLVGVLGLLWTIDFRFGLVLSTYALVALFVISRLRHLGVDAWEKVREASAKATAWKEEILGATEDVRPNGAAAYVVLRFLERSRAVFWASVRAAGLSGTTTVVGLGFFGLSQVLALGMGAWLLSRGQATIGTVYLLTQYTAYLSGPIDGFTYRVRYLQQATAAVNRIVGLASIRSTLAEPDRPIPLPPGPLEVRFDSAQFAYENDEPVLSDLTLTLAPGRSVGLVGRTGSGKTTLGRLVARQYDVSQGAVLVGGVPVREAALEDLRDRVAVVSQEVHLFGASIRQNLTLFRDEAEPRLLEVVADVGLDRWLSDQPDGLDSRLDPGALSAGEAQLLALARTLLRDPGLVILDEASARLDPATEARLQAAIDRLLEGRTAIVIAHRLSTLAKVDEIAVIDGGRVVEHGARVDLESDPDSAYSRLLSVYRHEVLA